MPVAFSMSVRNGVHSVFRFCVDSVEMMPKLISLGISARAAAAARGSAARAIRTERRSMRSTSFWGSWLRGDRRLEPGGGGASSQAELCLSAGDERRLAGELGAGDSGQQ